MQKALTRGVPVMVAGREDLEGILADEGVLACYAISYFEISTCGDMVLRRSIWHDICVDYRSTQALML
ncbi:MAG: hypothetical protein ACYTE5_00860 [Planctomycetota bacterium]